MKLQTVGLKNNKLDKIAFFQERLDPEVILEALGIESTGRVGPNIMAHCPDPHGLHKTNDNNPSWGFHVDKMVYNCFVCGGGTIVDLVEQFKGYDEETAIDWLRVNSDLDPATADDFRSEIEKILAPPNLTIETLPSYSTDSLFQYKFYHPYLLERGINGDVANRMNVGFDSEHMAIVIPHFFRGQLVGLQRRHLLYKDDKFACPRCGQTEKHVSKYKNTASFPKSTTLYNYDNLDFSEPIVVVESPFTALYLMSQGGYPNITATFGSFGPEQMALLLGAKEIWLWPDNDSAGLENLKNSLLILERSVRTFIIPAVPGEKSDGADVASEDLQKYFDAKYPSMLFGMDGLKVLGE